MAAARKTAKPVLTCFMGGSRVQTAREALTEASVPDYPAPRRAVAALAVGTLAGAVNGEGALTVRVTRTGDATTLSQIMRLVEEAQASRGRFQVLADRAAFWLTIIAVGVAVPTLIVWLLVGENDITFAVARAVTVLVIA